MTTSPSLPSLPRLDLPAMSPNASLAPYVLTRDTTCREGCPHYGHPAPPHSHYTQTERPAPAWEPNWFWRLAFRIWGDGGR